MLTLITICVTIILTGCRNGNLKVDTNAGIDNSSSFGEEKNLGEENSLSSDKNFDAKNVNFQKEEVYKYNEAGKIIIVMYHKFADVETDEYSRSFENFKKDLEYLYELGYRTISLTDYLENNIKVPVRLYAYYLNF